MPWKPGQREARKDEIRLIIEKAKNQPCKDCQQQFHPVAMTFDHRDPSIKNYKVSEMISRTLKPEIVRNEIAKCDIVCANCHALRSYEQRKNTKWHREFTHGKLP